MAGFNVPIAHVSLDKTALPSGDSLKDGGFVFVRVLSSSPDGKALVSFAGRQFEVSSLRNVEAGTAFKAQVKITGNTILLVPQQQKVSAEQFQQLSASNFFSPQNAAFFAALGLPSDSLTFQLLQQFQQSGLKINSAQILKAKKAASSFPQNEDEAAEAALLLLQKGLEPDTALVAQVLQLLHDGGSNAKQQPSDYHDSKDEEADGDFPRSMYDNAELLAELPAGLLTLVNHLKSGERHWIILPYEYGSDETFFNGTIRLLCDTEKKNCEKMAVSVFMPSDNLFFFVETPNFNFASPTLKKNKIHVYYSCEPMLSEIERKKKSVLLEELFGDFDCEVTYSESLAGHAFFVPELCLRTVRMDV